MIPNGAIGARFSPDGATLYLTEATGLGIYDVMNPESPQIRSHVPLPRIDVDGAMHLVDVSDPSAPRIVETRPAPGDLTVYEVRDLWAPPVGGPGCTEQLAWVSGEDESFAFDITEPARPRLVLGGPGEPGIEHERLLCALTRGARTAGWPGRGAPVGWYVSAGSLWGAYLAPTTARSWGRVAELLSGERSARREGAVGPLHGAAGRPALRPRSRRAASGAPPLVVAGAGSTSWASGSARLAR